MTQHALVIGIDGLRHDHVGSALTPCLHDLGAAGFLAPVLVDEQTPTWSGPCWATIATGVTVAEHAILHNDFTGHRLAEHPDFLTTATRAGLSTFLAISGWPPLALAEDGGPLFAEVSRREFVPAADEHSAAAWDCADEAVTVLAAKVLAADAPDLSFVYLGAVDITGHTAGAGTAYREAASAADRRLGRLVSAVGGRPDADAWTIVAVTDHGHLDGGGHGGREPEVATAWAAGRGPAIDPAAPSPITRHTDIAPLVLAAALERPLLSRTTLVLPLRPVSMLDKGRLLEKGADLAPFSSASTFLTRNGGDIWDKGGKLPRGRRGLMREWRVGHKWCTGRGADARGRLTPGGG